MDLHYDKPLTNIEKLYHSDMSNKIIVQPADCYNNLLYERDDIDNYCITAYNPYGYKAKCITKKININALALLTYKLLTPKVKPTTE